MKLPAFLLQGVFMANKDEMFLNKKIFITIVGVIVFTVLVLVMYKSDPELRRRSTFNGCLEKVVQSSKEVSKETIQACEDTSFRLVPPKM